MKQAFIYVSALVLTAALMTGCGCRNTQPAPTTMPTTVPTTAATVPTTQATIPSTETTAPTAAPTIEDGNGPVPDMDSTLSTEDTGVAGRSRRSGLG